MTERKREIRLDTHREKKRMNDQTNDPTNEAHYPLNI